MGAEAQDDELEDRLRAAIQTLNSLAPRRIIALTVFSGFPAEGDENDPLADPWVKIVGGELERRPSKREAVVADLMGGHASLRSLAGTWERTLGNKFRSRERGAL